MNYVTFAPGDPHPAAQYNGVQQELVGVLQILNVLLGSSGGYVGPAADNAFVEEVPSDTAVTVKGPAAYWIPLSGTSLSGGTPFFMPGDVLLPVPALNTTAGQSRNDLIVARVNVGSLNSYSYQVVQGTPATTGSQVTPEAPPNSFPIARITRAHGATNILQAMITDLRFPAKIPAIHQA